MCLFEFILHAVSKMVMKLNNLDLFYRSSKVVCSMRMLKYSCANIHMSTYQVLKRIKYVCAKYCNVLNVSHNEQYKIGSYVRQCNNIIEKNKMLIGKTPSAITSALIYFVISKLKYSINKKEMCESHKISVVTLNKVVHSLKENSKIFDDVFCK